MCTEVTTFLKKPSEKIRTAWKCINLTSKKDIWYPISQPGIFSRGQWEEAAGVIGFNCYTTKKAAQKAGWPTSDRAIRVRVRQVYGYNRTAHVLFAWEVFVPKRLKNGL